MIHTSHVTEQAMRQLVVDVSEDGIDRAVAGVRKAFVADLILSSLRAQDVGRFACLIQDRDCPELDLLASDVIEHSPFLKMLEVLMNAGWEVNRPLEPTEPPLLA